MTDKPQELDEILNQLVSKTADASYGEWEVVGLPEAKQAMLDWHNKQMSELLDRLAIEVRDSDYIGIAETIQSERNKLTMANSPQLDKLKERDDE